MDRLLHSVGRTFDGVRFGRPYPPINIYDLDDEYLLTAELAGAKSDDFEVSVAGGTLTLRGRSTLEDGIPEERYRRSERPRTEWERSLTLPDRVQDEQMYAELRNGVLKVHLPKAPSAQPRQIPVVGG